MTDSLFEAVAHATRELTKYGFSTQEFYLTISWKRGSVPQWISCSAPATSH